MSGHRRHRMSCMLMLGVILLAGANEVFAAGSEADFKKAIEAAEAANKKAGDLKNQWTTTGQSIAQAKKTAADGDFDKATALAKHAQDLAEASIAQAEEQKKIWKDAEIR